MTELCRVWADLAADPENADAVAAARARLMDLVWHVGGGCETCAIIGEAMPFPERVFAVLGKENLNLSPEQLQELREIDDELSADNRNAIPEAVEFLLAGLPPTLAESVSGFGELEIFDAIDAVSQLVMRAAGAVPRATIEISGGGVRLNGGTLVSRSTAVAEIARHAGVSDAAAESLWRWQLQAAEYCPMLYPTLEITETANGVLRVALEKPSATRDLLVRWQVRHPLRSKTQWLDVLAELMEAVAAGTRALLGLKRERLETPLGRLVERITTENAKIVEMVDAVSKQGGEESAALEGDAASGQATTMPTVLKALRVAEQEKRRCLSALADAPAETIAGGRIATRFKTFVAESRVAAGRNIIELEKFVKS